MTDKSDQHKCGCGKNNGDCESHRDDPGLTPVSRRDFLKRSAVIGSGAAALIVSVAFAERDDHR